MGTKMKKVKKKRLNIARTLVFILFVYIIVCVGLYIYEEPVRHYEISGTDVLTDMEIIRELKLEDYPPILSLNLKKLERKLRKNYLVKDVDISYGWNFKLKIEVVENTPLFLVKDLNKVCLSDGKLIENDRLFFGLPTLLNSTPEEIMKVLAQNLSEVDSGIRYIISEIEYSPSYNSLGKVIDQKRFLLSMNDKNMVYITANKAEKLNQYLDIVATEQVIRPGTLYLNSDEGRYTFKFSDDEMVKTTTTTVVKDDKDDEE